MPDWLIVLVVYMTGTAFGWMFGVSFGAKRTAEITIDTLIEDGFLKSELDENGNVILVPLAEDD